MSIDTALSTSESADHSVLVLTYINRDGYHVLSVDRGRWDYEALMARVNGVLRRHGRNVWFLVEAAGVGISLISRLRKSGLRCFSYSPREDKQTRAAFALPAFHGGRVHVLDRPGENHWVRDFLNEFAAFPHGRFDDQVDSLVQLINWGEPRFNSTGRITIA